jgi:RecA/RadA recombinase
MAIQKTEPMRQSAAGLGVFAQPRYSEQAAETLRYLVRSGLVALVSVCSARCLLFPAEKTG